MSEVIRWNDEFYILASSSLAENRVSRLDKYPAPWRLLVPLRVTSDTCAPDERPWSAP